MISFVADIIGFYDVNPRNLQIERTRLEAPDAKENVGCAFDCLCFVTNGGGYVKVAGKTYRNLSRDSVVHVGKNETAQFVSTDDEFEIYSVTVDTFGKDKLFSVLGFTKDCRVLTLDGKMADVESLYETAKRRTAASTYASVGKFYGLLSSFVPSVPEKNDENDENRYVNKAKEYIHMQYHLDINVGSIANEVYLNRSYFSTMFKRVTGMSPLEYLTDFRIKQACKLLEMGKRVTDTAMLTGFSTGSAFAMHFKKIMNETPSEYRTRTSRGGK